MGKKYQPSCKKELRELLEKDVCLGDIDTSLITDMTELFLRSKRKNFDGLETWDTSNVTGMSRMFCMAEYFNHPIECWDVSKVRDMSHMFSEASAFDQPLEGWDVSNVRNMESMFAWARSFNRPLEGWNVSNAENMRCMFYYAKSFNRPLEAWNVSNVENMALMFDGAERFDQPLDRWDVSKVKKMDYMFREAASFRQPLTAWRLRDQSPRHIFLRSPCYRDMESRVMCLAALDVNSREYDLQEMVKIFGAKAVCDALLQYGAEYGAAECVEYVKSHYADELKA